MKIALFTDCYDQVNGISNTLQHLVRYCRINSRELDLFTHSEKPVGVEQLGTVRIFRHPYRVPVRYYVDMAFDLLCLRRSILKEAVRQDYNLVHITTPGSMGLNGLRVSRSLHLPCIGSYHTALPEFFSLRMQRIIPSLCKLKSRTGDSAASIAWKYQKWFYGGCQLLLAPTVSVRNQLQQHFDIPVTLFSRGVDADLFHPRFRKSREATTLLYVGRLAVEKNLDMLVELAARRKNLHMMIVGDGPSRSCLERMLPRAVFTGILKGQALSEAYASSDIFICPSLTDTFGNVVLEAMSSGLPVLVADRMGPKELVSHGNDGFVCGAIDEFDHYLEMLATSRELRERMGGAARQSAERKSWSHVFDQLFDDYASVCASGAGTPNELSIRSNVSIASVLPGSIRVANE